MKLRRLFLYTVEAVITIAAFNVGAVAASANPSPQKPNLVFILGEGLRFDEFSFAGNKILSTPNMDRIAREGFSFQNAFVVNALCVPSRATILTGVYSHTTGAVSNVDATIPPQFKLISDLLHENGYETAFIGKSHVKGALRDHYWDYYFGFAGQEDYYRPVMIEGFRGKYGEPKEYTGEYADDLVTQKAIEWLQKKHDKPFCLFLWFYAPHAPFYRPKRMVNLFNGVSIPKPATFDEDLAGYPGKAQATKSADNQIGSAEIGTDDPRSLEELVKDHYAGVESNDENVGAVMKELERRGILDQTAIILSSDHGFFLGEHHFYDKRLMYEPSIRIPFILRYPNRIPAGGHSDKMVLNLDIAPTILDLAGIPAEAQVQGRSVMPIAERKEVNDWRTDWLYEYYEYPGWENVKPCRGIRTERYKLIVFFLPPEEFELYDLQLDPDEQHNLYGDPRYSDLAKQLRARMEELRVQTGDHYEYDPSGLPLHPAHE
ncbi:MAG TPA: sulfatase [Terriglobales bacterium]